MHDHHAPQRETTPSRPSILKSGPRVSPSSSKMLTNYLADIEQLLDEQNWEVAVREARDLPRVAVALSDAQMRMSGERVLQWCSDWIRPLKTDSESHVDLERVTRSLMTGLSGEDKAEAVPAAPLRRFRLRRLARTPPSRFPSDRTRTLNAEGTEAVELCTTLADAMRRWYAHEAAGSQVVQANLARLAVLR